MPSGVGATTIQNDPSVSGVQFVVDPAAFFDMTERNVYTARRLAAPGSGGTLNTDLPQAGVLAHIQIIFEGQLSTTLNTGTITTANQWPYGLLDEFILSVNAQNDVYSIRGTALHALDRLRAANGFFGNDTLDTFPSDTLGAGGTIPEADDQPIVLTWDVPISIDPTSLVGAIYAQSTGINLQARLRQAVNSDLLVLTGDASSSIDSLTGVFSLRVTSFDVPVAGGEQPMLVVPDTSRLHAVQGLRTAFASNGEIPHDLVRGNGQLDRLVFTIADRDPDATVTDSVMVADADADEIDSVRLEYGNAQRPLVYDPAHGLAQDNLRAYGQRLPYGFLAMDLVLENAPRDIIQMAGVTDLRLIPTLNTAVTPAAGAEVYAVQEMLIA